MHSLEKECAELQAAGLIDAPTAARGIALEQRAVLSVAEEVRVALYASVAGIATGIGIVLRNNLDRIGPVGLSVALAVVAGGCYASAIHTHRLGRPRSIAGDYVLLLGALILSADLGYIESQFHWFGANWSWQLLLLALLHGACAYVFDSRLLLSVSLASFAGWFGVEANIGSIFDGEAPLRRSGTHSLLCAGIIAIVREVHRRVSTRDFGEVYEHFAANLGFWGALAFCFTAGLRWVGLLVLIALAVLTITAGLRRSQETFVVYGVAYAALGIGSVLAIQTRDVLTAAVLALATVIVALVLLWRLHRRLRAMSP